MNEREKGDDGSLRETSDDDAFGGNSIVDLLADQGGNPRAAFEHTSFVFSTSWGETLDVVPRVHLHPSVQRYRFHLNFATRQFSLYRLDSLPSSWTGY